MFFKWFKEFTDPTPNESSPEIKMVRVSSSHLRGVGYDAVLNGLIIDFHTRDYDHIYYYVGVPESVYQALLAAPSKGTFFWNEIRFKYDYFLYQ